MIPSVLAGQIYIRQVPRKQEALRLRLLGDNGRGYGSSSRGLPHFLDDL